MQLNGCKVLSIMALLLTATLLHAQDVTVQAITAPSDQRKLSFNFPGIVREVAIKEGEMVKSGQVLAVQDDEVEKHELDKLQVQATSTARLDAAVADLEVKKVFYERKRSNAGGFAQAEIEEARLDVVFRENQVKVAEVDMKVAGIEAQKQAARVARMQLKSPIDGIIQRIGLRGGELSEMDNDKPAIVVVKNDPAWVEIKELRSWQVAKLAVGETMQVRYPGEKDWQQGRIIFIDPTTFPGTDNQLVRLELPNPQNRATGLAIEVKLPPKLAGSETNRTALR